MKAIVLVCLYNFVLVYLYNCVCYLLDLIFNNKQSAINIFKKIKINPWIKFCEIEKRYVLEYKKHLIPCNINKYPFQVTDKSKSYQHFTMEYRHILQFLLEHQGESTISESTDSSSNSKNKQQDTHPYITESDSSTDSYNYNIKDYDPIPCPSNLPKNIENHLSEEKSHVNDYPIPCRSNLPKNIENHLSEEKTKEELKSAEQSQEEFQLYTEDEMKLRPHWETRYQRQYDEWLIVGRGDKLDTSGFPCPCLCQWCWMEKWSPTHKCIHMPCMFYIKFFILNFKFFILNSVGVRKSRAKRLG